MLTFSKNSMVSLMFLIVAMVGFVLLLSMIEDIKKAPLVNICNGNGNRSYEEDNRAGDCKGDDQHSPLNSTDQIREILKSVRVLCWVTTTLKNLQSKTRFVKMTWGKRCDVLLFIGSQEDKNFPVIRVNAPEGRDHLTEKTSLALQYVYEHYRDKADWFLKADDDTYIIMDNLKYFLSDFKTTDGLYFGFTFTGGSPAGYNSGGGGYVLSQEALKRFYETGKNHTACPVNEAEDMYIGDCMYRLKVKNVNTLDKHNRTRFHSFHPLAHIDASNSYVNSRSSYGYKSGVRNISTAPISFHYVTGNEMRLLDFLIYHIRHVSNEGTVLP